MKEFFIVFVSLTALTFSGCWIDHQSKVVSKKRPICKDDVVSRRMDKPRIKDISQQMEEKEIYVPIGPQK